MNFARICIEVTPPVMPSSMDVVVIDAETETEKVASVRFEYQNKPQLCSHCKSFGHSLIRCPRANYKWVPKTQFVVDPVPPDSVPQSVSSLGHFLESPNNWTLVSKGPKQPTGSSLPAVGAPNPFKPLIFPGGPLDFSDSDCTPSPNPLVGKLKVIDEKEGRELKAKAREVVDMGQSSKKKSKGGGGGSGKPQTS